MDIQFFEILLNFTGTLIESAAILGAAWIGVRHLSKVVNKATDAYFANYDNDDEEMKRFLLKAENEIIVLAQSGVNLLDEYKTFLSKQINKKKLQLKFMILSLDAFATMDTYLTGKDVPNYKELQQAVTNLIQLKNENKENVEVRILDSILAASVVAINLNVGDPLPTNFNSRNAAIHFMPYQYHRSAGKSPYTYFLPNHNTQFQAVASSIYSIWHDAKILETQELNEYLNEINARINSVKNT